tara:strand:+ start:2346 stop:3542 length:1197 start_codon:yes stop_codon:yes gene_type:complete
MQFEKSLSVSELTAQLKGLIESNYSSVFVKGEISNFTHHSSGHMYFTLKDKYSELKAVMFKGNNSSLQFLPKNGDDVILQGKLSIYEARGQYQIIAQHMEPAGIGALYLEFEKSKKRLKEEGLFDTSLKKKLPRFPTTIGIVSSITGAALRDMLTIFKRRAPQIKIIIRSALVQGFDAPKDIIAGIKEFSNHDDIDILIVARGGGSFEDLWPFNDEDLAREIVKCPIPIISAVGHETDITISDMVADLRAPTPSAASEITTNHYVETEQTINNFQARLVNIITSKTSALWQMLDNFSERLAVQKPRNVFNQHKEKINHLSKALLMSMQRSINKEESSYSNLRAKLNALSPINTLDRGYSIAYKEDRSIIRKPSDLDEGESFIVKLAKGDLPAKKISQN